MYDTFLYFHNLSKLTLSSKSIVHFRHLVHFFEQGSLLKEKTGGSGTSKEMIKEIVTYNSFVCFQLLHLGSL